MALDFSKLSALLKKDVSSKSSSVGVIGVDVGSSSIKIVQLHENRGVATLDTYGELQLGPYENVEIGRTTHLRIDKLIEAFVDIIREAAADARKVSVAISYSSSFMSIITMLTDNQEKIPAMIPIEARKYIPVPLGDVTIDWFPISMHGERKEMKILLAAIHNDAINRYESMVKGADLEIGGTEIEFFSTLRTVVTHADEVVAVIDFGASATKVYVINKGVVGKTHSVLMNGVELTNAIMQVRGVDFRTAEEQKRSEGLTIVAGDSALEKAFTQILERGFREIHTVLKRYEEEEGIAVEKVILCGGGAQLRGLVPYTQDMLSCPTELTNPFAKVAYPAFLEDTLKDAGPVFTVAVGAALRGFTTNT